MFSQFGTLNDDGQETGHTVHSSSRETVGENNHYSLRGRGSSGASTKGGEASLGARKKVASKKSKTQQLERISFDECVRQVSCHGLLTGGN